MAIRLFNIRFLVKNNLRRFALGFGTVAVTCVLMFRLAGGTLPEG
jgi:hypothetical protein